MFHTLELNKQVKPFTIIITGNGTKIHRKQREIIKIPEVNILDWCALVTCADILQFLDSKLSPYNHTPQTPLIYHRIAHNEQLLDDPQAHVENYLFQYPIHAMLHLLNH